jgi:chromosome segregation ATPase
MRPTVNGAQLNLAPGETATDRALMLTQKLAAVEDERKILAARVDQLKAAVEEKDKALLQASRDVLTACEEVSHTRTDLQQWKQEMVVLRDKLHGTEKENMTNLQSIISLLERFMDKDKGHDGGRMQELETKESDNEAPPPKKEIKGQ